MTQFSVTVLMSVLKNQSRFECSPIKKQYFEIWIGFKSWTTFFQRKRDYIKHNFLILSTRTNEHSRQRFIIIRNLKKICLIFTNLLQHVLIKLSFNFRTVSSTNNANCYFRWGDFGVISNYFGDFVPPAYLLLWQRWRQGVWYLHGQLCLGKQCNFEGKDYFKI